MQNKNPMDEESGTGTWTTSDEDSVVVPQEGLRAPSGLEKMEGISCTRKRGRMPRAHERREYSHAGKRTASREQGGKMMPHARNVDAPKQKDGSSHPRIQSPERLASKE
jgi:hypothetical protein